MKISVQLAQALNMYLPLAMAVCFYNGFLVLLYALEAGFSARTKNCISIIIFGILIVLMRLFLADKEYKYIHKIVNKRPQRK